MGRTIHCFQKCDAGCAIDVKKFFSEIFIVVFVVYYPESLALPAFQAAYAETLYWQCFQHIS
jgi:hypothetical protein